MLGRKKRRALCIWRTALDYVQRDAESEWAGEARVLREAGEGR